ncbi:MAG: hypothetical protein ABSB61_01495 [Anaerolineales bacterium]
MKERSVNVASALKGPDAGPSLPQECLGFYAATIDHHKQSQ